MFTKGSHFSKTPSESPPGAFSVLGASRPRDRLPLQAHRSSFVTLVLLCLLACRPSIGPSLVDDSAPAEDTDAGPTDCPGFNPGDDPRFAALLEVLAAELGPTEADAGPSGASVAVVVDGTLLSAGGVGAQSKSEHPRADQPVGADTMFWIGSTSKWVTSVAAMSLVEDGLLDLHAPVTDPIPEYTETNGNQDDITLHHLLRMKSGLLNDGGCYLYSESAQETPTGCAAFTQGPATVLEELFRSEVLTSSPYDGSLGVYNITGQGAPGEAPWYYSNWGVMLAGRAMEAAAVEPFADIVSERVFGPASMCTAGYEATAMTAQDDYALGGGTASVDGYCPEPELGHDSVQPFYPDELACPAREPNGGVRASAVDMGRFAEALLVDLDGESRLLERASALLMLCPEGGEPGADCQGRADTGGSFWGDSYGYLNFHDSYRGHELYTHGGARAGFGSLFWTVPASSFAVVVLGNDDGVASDMIPVAEYALRCYLEDDCQAWAHGAGFEDDVNR